MAQNEIEILIRAVDEISATVKKIEGTLGNFTKTSEKQSEAIGKGFTGTTDSLLALGNAASSVDRIFSSLTNLSLRLENAHEKLANTQDRARDAQTKLSRLQKSGTATVEELSDANQELTRANRGLTISQNNLARVQNQVIGTYINIGIQTLVLFKSLGPLKTALDQTTISINAMNISLGTLLTTIGIAVGGIIILIKTVQLYIKTADAIVLLQESIAQKTANSKEEFFGMARAIAEVSSSLSNLLIPKTKEELELHRDLLGLRQDEMSLDKERQGKFSPELAKVRQLIEEKEARQDLLQTNREIGLAQLEINSITANDEKTKSSETLSALLGDRQNLLAYISTEWKNGIVSTQKTIMNEELASLEQQKTQLKKLIIFKALLFGGKFGGGGLITNVGEIIRNAKTGINQGETSVGDAIIKPDGSIIHTDPRDTLVAMKDVDKSVMGMGGGMTIIIEGNIYGTNPNEMAQALWDKIRRKASL